MPSKNDVAVVRAIGIDTGKNTLHMVGLDEKGAIVLREKVSRNRIAARLVNVPPCRSESRPAWPRTTCPVNWLRSVTTSNRCRRLMPGRFGKATRTTSETPRQSRKLCNALRHVACRSRRMTKWTCRRCTACVLA